MLMHTFSRDIMERCCARTATAVSKLSKGGAEYHGGRSVDGEETVYLFVCSRHYHMKVNPRRNIQAGCFD